MSLLVRYINPRRSDEAGLLIVASEADAEVMKAELESRGFVVVVVERAPFTPGPHHNSRSLATTAPLQPIMSQPSTSSRGHGHPDNMPTVKLNKRLIVALIGVVDDPHRLRSDRIPNAVEPGD